jgi:hypothetical protein
LPRPGSRAESFAETDADGRDECGRDKRRRHCEEAIADEAIQTFLLGGHLGMSFHEERRHCEEAIADEAIQTFLAVPLDCHAAARLAMTTLLFEELAGHVRNSQSR